MADKARPRTDRTGDAFRHFRTFFYKAGNHFLRLLRGDGELRFHRLRDEVTLPLGLAEARFDFQTHQTCLAHFGKSRRAGFETLFHRDNVAVNDFFGTVKMGY